MPETGFADMTERLFALRTPGELAIAPDGATIAFSVHPAAAPTGSHMPSDVWLLAPDGEARLLTDGSAPTWSPDGSRLAFLSDHETAGHALPYTMALDGQPVLAAELTGSAESVAWSADGRSLLVVAADRGLYGLDFSARAVLWATPPADPEVLRPGGAWRRLFRIDLDTGRDRGRATRPERVGGRLGRRHDGRGHRLGRSAGERLVSVARGRPRPGRQHGPDPYRPTWQAEGLVLCPDGRRAAVVEGYSSDPGLVSG